MRIWEFDPIRKINLRNTSTGVSLSGKDGPDKRILFTAGPNLFALHAEPGKPVEDFGKSGKVSLKEGLGERANDLYVVATSPGVVLS